MSEIFYNDPVKYVCVRYSYSEETVSELSGDNAAECSGQHESGQHHYRIKTKVEHDLVTILKILHLEASGSNWWQSLWDLGLRFETWIVATK